MNEQTTKWLAIINPMASVGKAKKDWPEIKRILIEEGFDFDEIMTEYPCHAIALVKDKIIEKGYKKIISVGGDGTLNEVVNGVMQQTRFPIKDLIIGVIPVGTGNDWVKTFDYPSDYRKIIKIIKAGQTFAHDVGKVSYFENKELKQRYFINSAGIGLDEMVTNKINTMKKEGRNGKLSYLLSLVTCLFQCKPSHVKIEVDEKVVFDDYILSISAGIGRYTGGGIMQTPHAIPDDGIFDLTVIRKVPLLKIAANVKDLYNGKFVDNLKEISCFRGKKIHMVSIPEHTIHIETDGETLGNSPFEFDIIQKAVNMVVKQKAIRQTHLDAKKQE
jgi:lipid kinase, YegS/Rv2252/BmrU family